MLVASPTEVPYGGCQRKLFRWDPSPDLCKQVHYINVMLLISLQRLQYMWKDIMSLHWCVASRPTGIRGESGNGDGWEIVQGV